MQSLQTLHDDGLPNREVGKWAERKYELVGFYSRLFSTAMKDRWSARIYIDLFCGPGRSIIRTTRRIIRASPLLALSVPDPFDKYIFCDLDIAAINTLQKRVEQGFPNARAVFIQGDANLEIPQILNAIPGGSKEYGVLSFCFVDPTKMGNLNFKTVYSLSDRLMDFLVLIPAYMDAHRNIHNYLRRESDRIEAFLGIDHWRERWSEQRRAGLGFGAFVTDQFGMHMSKLGYHYHGLDDTILIRHHRRHIPLYRLAFFSRDDLGVKFWREARNRTGRQPRLFD